MLRLLYFLAYATIAVNGGYFILSIFIEMPPLNRSPDMGLLERLFGFLVLPWLSLVGLYLSDRFDLLTMSDGSSVVSRFIWLCLSGAFSCVMLWSFYKDVIA